MTSTTIDAFAEELGREATKKVAEATGKFDRTLRL
jgi:hypothetical protein